MRHRLVGWVVFMSILFMTAPAGRAADAPYGRRRFVSPSGEFYACFAPVGSGESLVPRKAGAVSRSQYVLVRALNEDRRPSPSNESSYDSKDGPFGPDFVAPGDVVLAGGELTELPTRVVVSDHGRGFAALDPWGSFGGGSCVIAVSGRGVVRSEFALKDIWSDSEIERMPRTSDTLQWLRLAWYSGDESTLVLVPNGDVSWRRLVLDAAGADRVGSADSALLVPALSAKGISDRSTAWRIAAQRRIGDLVPAAQRAASDDAEDLAARVRAVAFLAELSSARTSDRDLVKRVAAMSMPGTDITARDAADAITLLPLVLGRDESAPLLVELLLDEREGAGGRRWAVIDALVEAGPRAADILGTVSADVARSRELRMRSARALGNVRSPGAMRRLLLLVEEGAATPDSLPLLEVATDSLAEYREQANLVDATFLRQWEREPWREELATRYFARVRNRSAVDPLIRALRRRQPSGAHESNECAGICVALRFQTGEDFGQDAAKWERWQASQPSGDSPGRK